MALQFGMEGVESRVHAMQMLKWMSGRPPLKIKIVLASFKLKLLKALDERIQFTCNHTQGCHEKQEREADSFEYII